MLSILVDYTHHKLQSHLKPCASWGLLYLEGEWLPKCTCMDALIVGVVVFFFYFVTEVPPSAHREYTKHVKGQ